MTTTTRLSVITCRLCGEKCYGQMDTGRWDIGHKRSCRMHPDYVANEREGVCRAYELTYGRPMPATFGSVR